MKNRNFFLLFLAILSPLFLLGQTNVTKIPGQLWVKDTTRLNKYDAGRLLRLDTNKAIQANPALTIGGFVFPSGEGALASTAEAGNGQMLIGRAGNVPVLGTISGTTNEINITTGSGTLAVGLPDSVVITGSLTLPGDPTTALQAAPKQYVDAISAGLKFKDPVATATTANITLSGEQTIDGVLTSASRVLVKNQSTASQNGIWVSAGGGWARATDMDADAEIPGAVTFVSGGTTQAGRQYVVSTPAPITVGSTAITWSLFFAAERATLAGTANQVSLSASGTDVLNGSNDITLSLPQDIHTAATPTFAGATYSGLTASLPVFTNGSKALVSNAMTGSGNVMMSASPTTTGTLTGAAANFSGNVTTARLNASDSVVAAHLKTVSGNLIVGGTGSITGSLSSGAFSATTGNFSSTLGVTGTSTLAAATLSGNLTLSSLSNGRIPIISTAGLMAQDDLYWDATNNRIGVGSTASSPAVPFHLTTAFSTAQEMIRLQTASGVGATGDYLTIKARHWMTTGAGTIAGGAIRFSSVDPDPGIRDSKVGLYGSDNEIETLGLEVGANGAVSVPVSLGVTGATTLTALTATTGSFSSNLGVTGTSTLTGQVNIGDNIQFTAAAGQIHSNTSDGSDTKRVLISGGGPASNTRGAYIELDGNEFASSGGTLTLQAGNVSTGKVSVYTAGSERLSVNYNGTITIADLVGADTRMVTANASGVLSTATIPAGVSPNNPSASVGLSAVNGTANTFMRSDAAPALSQAIRPTWTDLHTFSDTVTAVGPVTVTSSNSGGINYFGVYNTNTASGSNAQINIQTTGTTNSVAKLKFLKGTGSQGYTMGMPSGSTSNFVFAADTSLGGSVPIYAYDFPTVTLAVTPKTTFAAQVDVAGVMTSTYGRQVRVDTLNTNTLLSQEHDHIRITGSSTLTFPVPSANIKGLRFVILNRGNNTVTLTVLGGSVNINGATSLSLVNIGSSSPGHSGGECWNDAVEWHCNLTNYNPGS